MLLPLIIFLTQGSYFKEANSLVGNTDLLVRYSTMGLVVVTTLLVGVTAYYAYQTRNTVKEMKRATEIQFLSSLIARFVNVSSGSSLTFKINNVGREPAIKNKIKLSVKEIPCSYFCSISCISYFQLPLFHQKLMELMDNYI
jgi:hypothetical protein